MTALKVGDRVENVLNLELDARTVVEVDQLTDTVRLDFWGEPSQPLPARNYRRVRAS